MRTVLLISPSPAAQEPAAGIEPALRQAGYRLLTVSDVPQAAAKASDAAAVLLDATETAGGAGKEPAAGQPAAVVPGVAGAEAQLALARSSFPGTETPILIVLSREAFASPELLSSVGARFSPDDVIAWPCEPAELSTRIELARRRLAPAVGSDAVVIGELVIDPGTYEVSLHGGRLDLTFKEYELLKHLTGNRGQVFTREMLLRDIWGYDYYGGTRTVDVHVRRIRMKLGLKYGALVETVRNVGYRFSKEPPA